MLFVWIQFVTTTAESEKVFGNPELEIACKFTIPNSVESSRGIIYRGYLDEYPFDAYAELAQHKMKLKQGCISQENIILSAEVTRSVTRFAQAVSNFECTDPQAKLALKTWFSAHFSEEDLLLWRFGVDVVPHDHSDRHYSLRALLPCHTDYWVSGLWFPRPAWSHTLDKSILPLKCPRGDDVVVDIGAIYCDDKQIALRGDCSFVVNYLCESMIQQLLNIAASAQQPPSPPPDQQTTSALSGTEGTNTSTSTSTPQGCLMYSFGLGGNLDLETFMADIVG